jgi:regulator of protease activity HflC (stomatin/prohibitin superfamily)
MVRIANFIEASNPELAAKIWMRLLDSCELEEKAKKGYMPPVAGNESAAEAEALRALEEAEKDDQVTPQSDSNGVADGAASLQAETSPAEDLRLDSEV